MYLIIIVYLWYSLHKYSGLSSHLDFREQRLPRDQLGTNQGPTGEPSPRFRGLDAFLQRFSRKWSINGLPWHSRPIGERILSTKIKTRIQLPVPQTFFRNFSVTNSIIYHFQLPFCLRLEILLVLSPVLHCLTVQILV